MRLSLHTGWNVSTKTLHNAILRFVHTGRVALRCVGDAVIVDKLGVFTPGVLCSGATLHRNASSVIEPLFS